VKPETRALIKVAVLILTAIVAGGATVLAIDVIGLAWTGVVLAAALLVYMLKMVYDIELDRQRRLDEINKP
jgi:hypothetical protein